MKQQYQSYYLDSPLVKGRVFDVFVPEEITKDVAVLFVHGGGWRFGTRESFHEIMEALNNRGFVAATTDYRLYAKDAFQQLSDIRAAYMRFVSVLKEMGRPTKIAVYGESAGSHLASLLLFAKPGECGEEIDFEGEWVAPTYGILHATPTSFYHWEGMMPASWERMQGIAGAPYDKDPERFDRLSLIRYVNQDNPPIFFVEAELEHLFVSKNTLAIANQHRTMGIESHWKVYPLMEHGFFYELKRKGQLEAFEDICLFLDGKLNTI